MNHSSDLSEFSVYNYLFTPDLKMYLDSDNLGKCFMIRRTEDYSVVARLSEGILSPEFEKPTEVVKRFRWISNT